MHAKTPKNIVRKASELDMLSHALSSCTTYDFSLLSSYKYWSLTHIISHALVNDTKHLSNALKELSFIKCKKERYATLRRIQIITKNIYSYCIGLEYHSKINRDYIGVFKNELNIFSRSFQKWAKL